jgi:N-formylglutamate deformylase
MQHPLLISVPHGGWRIPAEVQEFYALPARDAFFAGDPFTRRLYDFAGRVSCQQRMDYSPAIIDLQRTPEEILAGSDTEERTAGGAAVYTQGCDPDETLRKLLLDQYYHPYYRLLEESLDRNDVRMGVDCHSMAAIAPDDADDAGMPRPLICLGNLGDAAGESGSAGTELSCEPEMIRFVREEFARVLQHEDVELAVPGSAALNIPFAGGRITRQMARRNTPFFQIQLSQVLYLARPHFDRDRLEADEARLKDLNSKVWQVLENTVRNL